MEASSLIVLCVSPSADSSAKKTIKSAARTRNTASTLYARRDMVERGWEIVTPILEAWKKPPADFFDYEAGSWGPRAAFDLIERDGRRWRRL